jgi:hypothetical protein
MKCRRAGLPFHVSCCTIAAKPDADIGRLITDYSHPVGGSMMFDGKKGINSLVFGPIRNPTAADICQIHANAVHVFPGLPLEAARLDIGTAYNRNRVAPSDAALGALVCEVVESDGSVRTLVAIMLTEQFGSADSNFHFDQSSQDCSSLSAARCMASCGAQLSGMYTDDFFVIASPDMVSSETAAFQADAEERFGETAIKKEKTLRGPHIDIIGLANDMEMHTIGMSSTTFAKMVCAFFICLPMDIAAGDWVGVKTLESLAQRAIRCADVVNAMAPFSRGFSACLRGLEQGATTARLSRRAFEDVWLWRIALQLGYYDRRWLVVPISVPLLFRRRHGEDDIERAYRQASCADHVIYADACTEHGNGMGFFIPNSGWNAFNLPLLMLHLSADGATRDVDINILEFVAALLALCALLPRVIAQQRTSALSSPSRRIHIHIWTDNTACMSWMLKHRAAHPLHAFLVQVFALLKVLFSIVVTAGHIPGVLNVYADAASRQFRLANGRGPELKATLESLPLLPFPKSLSDDIKTTAMLPSVSTSTQTLSALTALAGVRGWASQQ